MTEKIEAFSIWRAKSNDGDRTDIIYEYEVEFPEPPLHINVSSSGNEVHTIWKDEYGNNNGQNLRYKYDDLNPLAPTNLAGENYNNFPKISWIKLEPDIEYFEVWRQIETIPHNPEPWALLTTTSNISFVDYSMWLSGPEMGTVRYKCRAKDYTNHFSSYTSTVSFRFAGINKISVVGEQPENFELSQNYPNPFNPTTKITYALPEDAKVQIKVYDMLGTEVAELVNDTKPEGFYEAAFDASDLSSGVYIYRITALSGERILFSQSKQMILLK